jgi:GT2 family glycosyltransferase
MDLTTPSFSIVIPTYARPKQLAACLQSLTELDFARERFEVIVVDDGSEKPLDSVVGHFRHQLALTLVKQQNAGPASARNTGARHAKGQFLAFTDDDCTPAPDWLKTLAARLADNPDCAIGGRTLNAILNNLYASASQALIDYLYSYYNADPGKATFLTSNNFALSTDRFHALGGFDTTFPLAAGEDREICDRWLHHGYRLVYAPEAVVYHTHALTLHSFCRQHFNYGRGAFYFHRLRTQRDHRRFRVEPLAFYLNLLRYPLSHAAGQQALWLAALLMMSQGANGAGFFWEKINRPLHGR